MDDNAIWQDDAAQVMDFLEKTTSGDLPQCLDVARQEYAETGAPL